MMMIMMTDFLETIALQRLFKTLTLQETYNCPLYRVYFQIALLFLYYYYKGASS